MTETLVDTFCMAVIQRKRNPVSHDIVMIVTAQREFGVLLAFAV